MTKTETLGQIIQEHGGSIKTGPFGTTLKANEYSETGVPIISVGEVGYGSLSLRKETPCAPVEVTKRLPEYLLEPGDIVFGRKGAVDRSAWVKESESGWFLGSDGIRLRLPSSVDSRFVAYQLQSETTKTWLLQHASGSTMLSLNQKILERVPLTLPEFDEQRAIADVLAALDAKIAANAKLADVSEHLAVTLLSQLKSTVALSGVVRHHKKSRNPELIGTAKVAHFSLPAFDAVRQPELTPPTVIKSSKFTIDQPSVLVSKLNPRFPRVWDVPKVLSIPALASTEFLVLEPLFSSTTFLWATLSQPAFGMALESKVAGTSGSHQRVKPTDLLDTPVLDPRGVPASLRDQVTDLGGRGAQARTESSFLTAIRDALLPQLMSGKLRVKHAEKMLEEAGV
ncbi:restriction endonuclease subunit S [Arthrobacter sp. MMS24-S77]